MLSGRKAGRHTISVSNMLSSLKRKTMKISFSKDKIKTRSSIFLNLTEAISKRKLSKLSYRVDWQRPPPYVSIFSAAPWCPNCSDYITRPVLAYLLPQCTAPTMQFSSHNESGAGRVDHKPLDPSPRLRHTTHPYLAPLLHHTTIPHHTMHSYLAPISHTMPYLYQAPI